MARLAAAGGNTPPASRVNLLCSSRRAESTTMIAQQTTISDRQLQTLADVVYKHCGITLHEGKRDLVQARIAKRLRANNCDDVKDYLDKLLADPKSGEFDELIDALSTNLTSFFRENDHFDYLRTVFLPALIARKSAKRDYKLRAWSAGCSSGEEPYTIAMTLLETVPNPGSWDIKLLATDISRPVLDKAKRGLYAKERIASVPPALRTKYFSAARAGAAEVMEVSGDLRHIIRFNYLNLMKPWPFDGPFDFIFCRNVMIYFDKSTQQRLVNRYHDVLDAGGLLFTGHSESLTGIKHPLGYIQPTIYVKGTGGAGS